MMRSFGRWLAWRGAGTVVAVAAVGAAGLVPAAAATGPVSAVPTAGTPQLASTGTTEQIRQLVDCGGTMYAVGTFTSISGWNGTAIQTVTRNNIFSFSDTAPYMVSTWAPDVNGTVNSIAFNNGNCADAYIGGHFTTVGTTAAKNIAEIDTATGAVVPGFQDNASGAVNTLLAVNGHLLAGGAFKGINGSKTDPYYVSLSPSTGKDDGYLALSVSGNYVYPHVKTNNTQIYNQQLSPNGSDVLVEGTFTSVGGLARQQIFMLGLGASSGTVTPWTSTEFNQFCAVNRPFYIQAAAWSPDGSEVYIATTGKNPDGWLHTFPLTGLCSVVAAFPATQGPVTHSWVNYTGCDSLYSVAADTSAVYVGGDERWADNASGCNHPGTGSVPAQGMGGFTPGPTGGALLENTGGTAGLYSRARGEGADDMLLTSTGLWIASDNLGGSASCGGVSGHAGLCFLPYS
jgi:hypothetical protein